MPVSVVWPLTNDQNAIVTGDLVALPQRLFNLQVKYENGVQRCSPIGVQGTWPAEVTENSSRFMQFALTPGQGKRLNVTKLALYLYVNAGSNMRANVYYSTDPSFTIKTQVGSTYALSSTAPGSPNVTTQLNGVLSFNDTLYVRIYPWYTTATTGKYLIVKNVTIEGTATDDTCLIVAPPILQDFIQSDPAYPSPCQYYTLSGINLTMEVEVLPPPAFAVSADGGITWTVAGDTLRLTVSGGAVDGQPRELAVRLQADTVGEYEGVIEHRSPGAAKVHVRVAGRLLAPEPDRIGMIELVSIGSNSITMTLQKGAGVCRLIAIKEGNYATWLPTDGYPVHGIAPDWRQAEDQGDGTKVVYAGDDTLVTISGLDSHTTYTVSMFEYNVGPGNTFNYLTTQFAQITFTTLPISHLTFSPITLDFGSVLLGQTKLKSYHLSGSFVNKVDSLHIIAPAGYELNLGSDSLFTQRLAIALFDTSVDTTIYVRFKPLDLGQYEGNIIHTVDSLLTEELAVKGRGVSSLIDFSAPIGFATLDGGTSGGAGGDTLVITTAQQLYEIVHARENRSNTPLVILIAAKLLDYPAKIPIKRTANLSLIGSSPEAGLQGFGMKISECHNIIVRNLTFADCHVDEKDALEIDNSHHVWIDHCSFTDSPAYDPNGSTHDGLLDIKNGSYHITVSFNRFWNHRQTCLLGHSPDQLSDTVMTVTYYANWFDGTYSRHPRVRFARVHLLNNLYTNLGSYGIGVTCGAQVLAEGNYFENVPTPILVSQVNDPAGTLSGDPAGFVKAVANWTYNCGTVVENLSGYNFDPRVYYAYESLPTELVKTLVRSQAGAGVLDTVKVALAPQTSQTPCQFFLSQNYPNPFNAQTQIRLQLPTSVQASLQVCDLTGRKVATLVTGTLPAGTHCYQFDGSQLPSGVYFYYLHAGTYRQVRKMLLLK